MMARSHGWLAASPTVGAHGGRGREVVTYLGQPCLNRSSSLFSPAGGRAAKQGVELRLRDFASVISLETDEDLIQQLVLNLTLNAQDAMPRGGTLEGTPARSPGGRRRLDRDGHAWPHWDLPAAHGQRGRAGAPGGVVPGADRAHSFHEAGIANWRSGREEGRPWAQGIQ